MSCTQTSSFTFQQGTPVDFEQAICIAKDNCLYFDSDSNLFYMRLYYSDKRKPPIDSFVANRGFTNLFCWSLWSK